MNAFSRDTTAADVGRSYNIDVELRDMRQLFNSMDPSPFHEKDLDREAEEFIVSSSEEYPPGTPLTLRIHLAEWPAEDPTNLIREAVHNYFGYRTRLNQRDFKLLMRRGRFSLIIGLLFLVACLLTSKVLLGGSVDAWASVVRESLTIAGWVAMWRPMEIYLYDWWPVRRRGRVFARLSRIPVAVIQKGAK